MSYPATVFNVMIASPGDVQHERSVIREVIHEWNDVNSYSKSIVLLPVGWESHSTPEMGNRPQEIINRQILDKCDLLIGVFWTRIGTPTDEFPSGTVEEVEKLIHANKPVMLYFSQKPVVYDSVDHDQYDKLNEFRASCRERGLYETYDSVNEFRDKFYRQLQIKINEDPFFLTNNPNPQETAVMQSGIRIPQLSPEAKMVLKEASTGDGTILWVEYSQGADLQTHRQNFVTDHSHRTIAKWKAVLQELISESLIEDRGYKGEVFEVTAYGYRVADLIET